MTIQTIEHVDVRGKKLHYIKFTSKKGTEFLVNVGEKTFDNVNTLIKEDEDYNNSAADRAGGHKQRLLLS